MMRAFKYRLYPNKAQEVALRQMLTSHRIIYNECLSLRNMAWQMYGVGISFFEQRNWFIKRWRDHPYWSKLNANSVYATIERLDAAFRNFFRRVKAKQEPGYPRFQGRDRFNSITFGTYPNGLKLMPETQRVYVQHVGEIPVVLHCETRGKIKKAALIVAGDKWHVVLFCDLGEPTALLGDKPAIGIDVGLESFLTTSDGAKEPNPRYLKNELRRLRVLGRAVARKKKGGMNRRKAVKVLRAMHERVKNLRREHHHQTALKLVRKYGMVAVEKLQVANMVQNRHLACAISDAGWSSFLTILKHKAESHGVRFVEVDPRGTSQTCSQCGKEVRKDLSVRQHDCPFCGLSICRDVNAARNILARARMQARIEPLGANVAGCRKRFPRRAT